MAWTKAWQIEVLNTNSQYVRNVIQVGTQEEDWDQFGGRANSLANCSKLGDNFVVNVEESNEEGIEFYVMFCTQPTHILKEDYTCHWGT
jgi:hypothetical protein